MGMEVEMISAHPLRRLRFTACSALQARQSCRQILPSPDGPYQPSYQRPSCQYSGHYFWSQVRVWFCFFCFGWW